MATMARFDGNHDHKDDTDDDDDKNGNDKNYYDKDDNEQYSIRKPVTNWSRTTLGSVG